MSSIPGRFLRHLAFSILPIACGLTETKEVPYPVVAILEKEETKVCPIGLAAFDYHIRPILEDRCMAGCHVPNGNAASVLAFSGQTEVDSRALRSREGGTADGIFRKARGLSPHVGGAAAREEDLASFEKWFAAEKLCN